MAADWSALTRHLKSRGDWVILMWDELAAIVGEVPSSAIDHAAWWSGDRPHTRAWRAAGYEVASKRPGHSVTFRRATGAQPRPVETKLARDARAADSTPSRSDHPDLLLVTCVKTKLDRPAAAKDLYISPLFVKERAYAEALGVPWFILSARWGLVAPDDWLSPYELRLDDTSRDYRAAWGAWVATRLAQHVAELEGKTIEIHAGQVYVEAVTPHLRRLGARTTTPLAGLDRLKRLAWYDARVPPSAAGGPPESSSTDVATDSNRFVELLRDRARALPPTRFLAERQRAWNSPGLYSWWVDADGARELSAGLGQLVPEGMIYAGLAGATRWPSGRKSSNTLWTRIAGMHLGGNHQLSTFRLTLGSVLAEARGWSEIDEAELTRWMDDHLRVVAEPYADGDTLGRLESAVLHELDPPLNLQGMPPSQARLRLKELRGRYSKR